MKALVTGSSGHLGEAIVRTLRAQNQDVVSIDIIPSEFTTHEGSITDKKLIQACMSEVEVVFHAATLHKPHVVTHSIQDFIDVNISGTSLLLKEASRAGTKKFIFTSTTSTFGDALRPPIDAPCAWVTEDVIPIVKNIYGATKLAAEDLCYLFHRNHGMNCIILKTSRFFLEEDDDKSRREKYDDKNLKINEYLYRRVDIEDIVEAHLLANHRAFEIGFGRYIITATTPFNKNQAKQLRTDLPTVLQQIYPEYVDIFKKHNWKPPDGIGRVYVNHLAKKELGWTPKYNFHNLLSRINNNLPIHSDLALAIGVKGYHTETFVQGPYPV